MLHCYKKKKSAYTHAFQQYESSVPPIGIFKRRQYAGLQKEQYIVQQINTSF